MATASQALRDPEMDGERILLLVQEAEIVTGIERRREKLKSSLIRGVPAVWSEDAWWSACLWSP